MIHRRGFLASAAAFAAPAIGSAQSTNVLRFVPQADVAVLDPIVTTANVTRNHAFLVSDTLYGMDADLRPRPQMLDGQTIADDRKTWDLTLREALHFHDGTPVLARDAVASIRRWGRRDPLGGSLMSYVDELSVVSDRVLRFRLRAPFPLLPAALGKVQSNMCPIVPERLAATDPFRAMPEMVGSGPFRFLASERVPGSRVVCARNETYVPRAAGPVGYSSGPKIVHFHRVEWDVLPDSATAAGAMQAGEMD